MRRRVVETLALALVFGVTSTGMGQPATPQTTDPITAAPAQPKTAPAKSKLEEMLAEALKSNPDIRVAEAKLAEADAELNRTRLHVTQKVIALHHALLSQKAAVEYEQKKFERMKQLSARAAIDSATLDEAQQALTLAKAKLAELEAQMPAVLGKVTHASEGNTSVLLRFNTLAHTRLYPLVGEAELIRTPMGDRLTIINRRSQMAAGPLTDKIRAALEKPISLKVSNEFASEVLSQLQKQTGLTFKRMVDSQPEPKINLEFTDLSLRAALQYIEDSEPGDRFVIRDYGILFAPESKLPPGALTVQEFLRQPKAEVVRDAETKPRNPPTEDVHGIIKRVDASGLVTISIGSDAGLVKGHTLEVFRQAEKPSESKYLGTIRILETHANEAVGQPVGRMAAPPKSGDKVASRIQVQ